MTKKAVAGDVVAHWSTLVENFRVSPQGFYGAVAGAIQRREIPGATTSKVLWSEAGALSADREYFRVTRGRLVFDVCAAPFGKGFFSSWWLAEARPSLRFLYGTLIGALLTISFVGRLSKAFQDTAAVLWPLSFMCLFLLTWRSLWQLGSGKLQRSFLDSVLATIGLVSFGLLCVLHFRSLFGFGRWLPTLLVLLALGVSGVRARLGQALPGERLLLVVGLLAFLSGAGLREFEYYAAITGLALLMYSLPAWLAQKDKPTFRDALAGVPVLGRVLAPETYYKIDTTSMFRLAAQQAVHEAIEKLTTAQGLRALTELERKPVMRGFFGQ